MKEKILFLFWYIIGVIVLKKILMVYLEEPFAYIYFEVFLILFIPSIILLVFKLKKIKGKVFFISFLIFGWILHFVIASTVYVTDDEARANVKYFMGIKSITPLEASELVAKVNREKSICKIIKIYSFVLRSGYNVKSRDVRNMLWHILDIVDLNLKDNIHCMPNVKKFISEFFILPFKIDSIDFNEKLKKIVKNYVYKIDNYAEKKTKNDIDYFYYERIEGNRFKVIELKKLVR